MHHRTKTLSGVAAFTLAWTLAGCITVNPVVPQTGAKPGTAPSAPVAAGAKGDAVAKGAGNVKPKSGDQGTLDKLKSQGRVQVSFKGLGSRARRALKQTTADIARVEVTLTGQNGFTATQSLKREQMMGPVASLFFDRVPVGGGALKVRVFDFSDKPIGESEQDFEVVGGKTTEVAMTVKLGNSGSVGAVIDFAEPDVEASNVTGNWYVGRGQAPDFPMIGCGDSNVWYVSQVDQTIWASASGYNDMDAPSHPGQYWSEEATGTIFGNTVKLHGRITYTDDQGNMMGVEEADYDLTFLPERFQLVGMRNGEPTWAAPYTFDPNCFGPTPEPWVPGFGPTPGPIGSARPFPVPSASVFHYKLRLEGRVLDWQGNPFKGGSLMVSWWDDATGEQQQLSTPIRPDGSYMVEGVPSDKYVDISANDGGSQSAYTWQMFYGYGDGQTEYFDVYAYAPDDTWTPGPDWTPDPFPSTDEPTPSPIGSAPASFGPTTPPPSFGPTTPPPSTQPTTPPPSAQPSP